MVVVSGNCRSGILVSGEFKVIRNEPEIGPGTKSRAALRLLSYTTFARIVVYKALIKNIIINCLRPV
jgi:hypothetical protein